MYHVCTSVGNSTSRNANTCTCAKYVQVLAVLVVLAGVGNSTYRLYVPYILYILYIGIYLPMCAIYTYYMYHNTLSAFLIIIIIL